MNAYWIHGEDSAVPVVRRSQSAELMVDRIALAGKGNKSIAMPILEKTMMLRSEIETSRRESKQAKW